MKSLNVTEGILSDVTRNLNKMDKNSASYFLTRMTQEEFAEIGKKWKWKRPKNFSFNLVKTTRDLNERKKFFQH